MIVQTGPPAVVAAPMGITAMPPQTVMAAPMGVTAMAMPMQQAMVQPVMAQPQMPVVKARAFAPMQVNMGEERKAHYVDFNLFPSITVLSAAGSKQMYSQTPECQDACMMALTCGCQPVLKYREDQDLIEFTNVCLSCCPWETRLNGKVVGTVETPWCLENGFLYCACPWFVCNGTAKTLEIHRAEDFKEIMTVRRDLFPCWKCTDICCACLGACCGAGRMLQACDAFCNYVQAKEYRQLKMPLFPPLEEGEEKVGEITIIHRASPGATFLCCCATVSPVRVTLEVPTTTTEEDVINLGLLTQFFLEPEWPCKLSSMASFRTPTGIQCFDCGLLTQVEWTSFDDIMDDGAVGEIARQQKDSSNAA